MKITQTDLFTIIEADEGMILVGPDGYGAKMLYLGIYDSPDNYTEINEEDYVEPTPGEESMEETVQRILNEEVNRGE